MKYKTNIHLNLNQMPSICQYPECQKYASYGPLGKNIRIYCKSYAEDGMVAERQDKRTCIHPDHNNDKYVRASFNFPDEKKPLYCKAHAQKGMINFNTRNSIKCQDCQKKHPSFGIEGQKATHCAKCADKNTMVDLISNLCIQEEGCALDNMVDVVNPMCTSCGLFVVSLKPYLCQYCKPNSTLREKTKEILVVNHLMENGYDFIHNKSTGFVCGNFRPDIKIDAGTHYVIVEIDEDQHSQYESRCEIARMYNICQAEGINCIFIRYNPDVWRVDGKVKKVFTQKRLDELAKMIDRCIDRCIEKIPYAILTVHRMFYNSDTDDYIQEYNIQSKYEEMFVNICQDTE